MTGQTFRGGITGLMVAAALSLGSYVAFPSSASALVVNGSFEVGDYDDNGFGFENLPGGSTDIAGWTVGPHSIDWVGNYWTPSDGNMSLDLSGNAPGSISQDIVGLITGDHYRLSFDVAANTDGPPLLKLLKWTLGTFGGSTESVLRPAASPIPGWLTVTFDFIWNGSDNTLTFLTGDRPGQDDVTPFGPTLDNVAIQAIPIPPAAILFLTALGGLGFLARRRSRHSGLTLSSN